MRDAFAWAATVPTVIVQTDGEELVGEQLQPGELDAALNAVPTGN
jgi:hypothetical protein